MFILSFFLIQVGTLAAVSIFHSLGTNKDIRNIFSAYSAAGGCCAGLLSGYFLQSDTDIAIIEIFTDARFLLVLLFEAAAFLIARQNYHHNHQNMTIINASLFSSLIFIPIIAFGLSSWLNFENTPSLTFDTPLELAVYIVGLTSLLLLYFAPKIKEKNGINNWAYIFTTPLVLACTLFLSTKTMQTYNPGYSYALISLFIVFLSLTLAKSAREFTHASKIEHRRGLKLFFTYCVTLPGYTLGIKLMAVELVAVFVRLSQVISGIALDRFHNDKTLPSKRDLSLLIAILIYAFIFYSLKQG